MTAKDGPPASTSREHSIRTTARGVVTITGGKLTTYREMAEQCVDVVVRHLGTKTRACDTTVAPLPGERAEPASDDVLLDPVLRWREIDVVHAVRHECA